MGLLPSTSGNTYQTVGGNLGVGQPGPLISVQPTAIGQPPAPSPITQITNQPISTISKLSNPPPPPPPGPTADQIAAAALQSKMNALIGIGTDNARSASQGVVGQGSSSIAGLGDQAASSLFTGQSDIDEARKNIGVSQINTIKQLNNTIKNGLYGTGVQLGNTGALDSSAAEQASRAYANYGNIQTNSANNTAATANQDQDVKQREQDFTKAGTKDQLDANRDAYIKTISATASSALDSLETSITYMGGDPNSVHAQDIKAQIVQNAQDQLAAVDQKYQDKLNAINPLGAEQTAQNAEASSNAGVVPSSQTPFNSTQPSALTTTNGAPTPSLIPLTLKQPNQQLGV